MVFLTCLLACLAQSPCNPARAFLLAIQSRPPSKTHGAPQKGAPQYRELLLLFFIPRIAILLRSLSSSFLFLPVYLSAVALHTPHRHTILTFAVVYAPHDQTLFIILAFPFPQLTRAMPPLVGSAVPSLHFIQIPRQIFLRPIRLPVHLSSRYCSCRSI